MFENEWFPKANAMGVSWQEFWGMNPHIIKLLMKGHEEKIKEKDYLAWWSNQYTMVAVTVAVERIMAGRKSSAEYVKEPALQKVIEESNMTQEELDERELRKMLMYEEQWVSLGRQSGLPETNLK